MAWVLDYDDLYRFGDNSWYMPFMLLTLIQGTTEHKMISVIVQASTGYNAEILGETLGALTG